MDVTGRQLRSARALMGWSVDEVAAKTDLRRATISEIEREETQPQERTLASLIRVFEKHGVEFLPNEGIQLRKQEAKFYSGKLGYRQFLDHVYETQKNGGHIRQFNFSDLRYLPSEESFVTEHFDRMSEIKGLDARVLEPYGEKSSQVSYSGYRQLDKKFSGMAPWYLYGDYLVLSLFETGGKREFVTIHSKLLAERYLNEFDIFWDMAKESRSRK